MPTTTASAASERLMLEYRRVCQQCGHAWYVDGATAQQHEWPMPKPIKNAMGGSPVAPVGRRRQQHRAQKAAIQSANISRWNAYAQHNASVQASRRCPDCGSGSFQESIAVPRGWHPDPTGRFNRRWWNGVIWTDQVADPEGNQYKDPDGAPDTA